MRCHLPKLLGVASLLWGVSLRSAHAQDPEPVVGCEASASALEASLEEAEQAFARMDEAAFEQARAAALESLRCLSEPVTPRLAAELHELMMLSSFRDMNDAATLAAAQSLVGHLPHYLLAPPLVSSTDHPLNTVIEQARGASPGLPVSVEMPRGAVLRLDGQRAEERQSALAAVGQVTTPQGEVLWSGYVWPEDPLPPLDLPRLERSPRQKLSRGLLIGGGAMALGGVVSLSAGLSLRAEYSDIGDRVVRADPTLTPEDGARYEALFTRSNTLGAAGQGAALAGLALTGLGVALVF